MEYELFAHINQVGVYLSKNISQRLMTAIKATLRIQIGGMESLHSALHHSTNKKSIYIEQYTHNDLKDAEIVPGAYIFSNGTLYDLKRRISLRISDDGVYFGLSHTFRFSIHFLYHLCAIECGLTFIHAAGFDINGKNILVPAFGGIGKTTLVSQILNQRSGKIYGDDLILVDKERRMYPYLRPLCLYRYHYKSMLGKLLKWRLYYLKPSLIWRALLRLRFEILNRLGIEVLNVSRIGYANGYITVPVSALADAEQIGRGSRSIDIVIVIKRVDRDQIRISRLIEEESLYGAAHYVSGILAHEWAEYFRMLSAYYSLKKKKLSSYFCETEKIVENLLCCTPLVFEMCIPIDYCPTETLKRIQEIAEESTC